MGQNALQMYDAIVLEPLQIPQFSRLYSIPPIEIGTSLSESISSYLTRLAEVHCVTLQKLIMAEIAPLVVGNKYHSAMASKNASAIFGNSDAKPAINGMRDKTKILVDILEKLTLQENLQHLSCLTYQGIIKERSLFRQHKVWCPKCFKQRAVENKPLYEPLLWSFKDVNYCPEHNYQLINSCPHCDSTQKAIANHSRLGYCDRCRQWLGSNSNSKTKIDKKEHQIIIGIGELIATTPLLNSPPTLSYLTQKLQLI